MGPSSSLHGSFEGLLLAHPNDPAADVQEDALSPAFCQQRAFPLAQSFSLLLSFTVCIKWEEGRDGVGVAPLVAWISCPHPWSQELK